MGPEFQIYFEVGLILFIAFIGAYLTKKFGQSVLIAYILIGVAIGPFGLGIIQSKPLPIDEALKNIQAAEISGVLIYLLAQIGLVLLLFFVGLEFSMSKLKRTKRPAIILATFDVAINVFAGIILGTYFGWPIIDTVFLACIIAMSSVAVTIKILEDLKRSGRPETEILISLMIVEDFASIILLTTVSSFVIGSKSSSYSIFLVLGGIVVMFVFFAVLSFIVLPIVIKRFEKINSAELILFSLGIVFLSSAFAVFFGIAAMVGAFLLGMGFSETKLAEQMKKELSSWKNVCVAVFFVSFGMIIDWRVFAQVGHLILIAVPLTIFNELILTAIIAVLIGLSAEAAVSVGAGALGRSEEAIIFANLGTNLKTAGGEPVLTGGRTTLAPFAGGFCLVMSAVTPFFMKSSYQIARFFRARLPAYIKFGGFLISRFLRGLVLNVKTTKTAREGLLTTSLTAYFVFMMMVIGCGGISHKTQFCGFPLYIISSIIFIALTATAICMVGYFTSRRFYEMAKTMEIPNLTLNRQGRREAVGFVNGFITGSFSVFLLMAVAWQFDWRFTLISLLAYVLIVLLASYRIYHRLVGEIQWRAREEIRISRTQKPKVLKHRPKTFTYRGTPWEQRNPGLNKKK